MSTFYHFWGSWVSQWWEHSPPTSVARASNPSVSTICGLSLLFVLSLAPRGFSPGSPVFLVLKNQHFQIPIRPAISWTKDHRVDVLPPNLYLFYSFIHLLDLSLSTCSPYCLSFSFITRHRRRKDPQMFKNVFKPVSRNLRCTCHCLLLCSIVQTLQL